MLSMANKIKSISTNDFKVLTQINVLYGDTKGY